jgi:hypothetical protein
LVQRNEPGTYSSFKSNTTGERAGTLGLPAAAFKGRGKDRLPGM